MWNELIFMVTTCMENLEILGNLRPARDFNFREKLANVICNQLHICVHDSSYWHLVNTCADLIRA